jgi:sugar phosphate isomerase/epimerase
MRVIFGATLSLEAGIARLPYLYTAGLEDGCAAIAAAGFDSIDLLLTEPGRLSPESLRATVVRYGLRVSAIASGGAWLRGKLHLCSPNPEIRREAESFVCQLLALAGTCKAAVVLGLVAGVLEDNVTREQGFEWLLPAMERLGEAAERCGARLLLEPLNPAETNLLSSLDDGIKVLRQLRTDRFRLLVDIYHLSCNCNKDPIATAIERAAGLIGHVHVADDNRRAPGFGQLDFAPVWSALERTGYNGVLSVEAFPWPDSDSAAAQSVAALRKWFPGPHQPSVEDIHENGNW